MSYISTTGMACSITATGITAPTFPTILAYMQQQMQTIYGNDINLDPSTQDGQLISILSKVINDVNNSCIAVYNQYSPTTAVGVGLSSIVKTNGLQREIPSASTSLLTLIGQAGTVINNGGVYDTNNNLWALPSQVIIPNTGLTFATATCTVLGSIEAPANTINTIATPTLGWQSANNTQDAVLGAPVETDTELRARQSVSTTLPAQTPISALIAAVANLPGVERWQVYENATGITSAQGIPPNTICVVVEGGDAESIANTIRLKKTMGAPTFGNVYIFTVDSAGIPEYIAYQTPNPVRLIVNITLTPLLGFVNTTVPFIQQALSNYINTIPIGGGSSGSIGINDLVAVAKLPPPLGNTYRIEVGSLTAGVYGLTATQVDVALNFADLVSLAVGDVNISIAAS